MRQGSICLEQKDPETALWREDGEGKLETAVRVQGEVFGAASSELDRFLQWNLRLPSGDSHSQIN